MKDQTSFIFAWDNLGIESIIPISKYDDCASANTWRILNNEEPERNPLMGIVQNLIFRARYNPQRHYEIYAVSCDDSLDEEHWRKMWEEEPQACANLIRERGQKIYSDRENKVKVLIE